MYLHQNKINNNFTQISSYSGGDLWYDSSVILKGYHNCEILFQTCKKHIEHLPCIHYSIQQRMLKTLNNNLQTHLIIWHKFWLPKLSIKKILLAYVLDLAKNRSIGSLMTWPNYKSLNADGGMTRHLYQQMSKLVVCPSLCPARSLPSLDRQ